MICEEIINSLLELAVEHGGSDIHIKSNKPGYIRLNGRLKEIDMDPITEDQVGEFVEISTPPSTREEWYRNRQVDYSYKVAGIGRFRVNAFYQRGTVSMVFRHVKDQIPTFEDLNLPEEKLIPILEGKDGIVLVCGPTGSGKSSTLAAMLNHVNTTSDKHVVTLEDPIEYNFEDRLSIFNQREIGIDAPDFVSGMRAVLRQDPDIILIGEMRDKVTFETALSAAETGHLVFGTLHAASAQQAVQRLFEFFVPEQQITMRTQIAGALRATITQSLIPSLEGNSRFPALEILRVDALTRTMIQEGKFEKISAIIDSADENEGSISFNRSLHALIKGGKISKKEGLRYSPNPKALEMNLKGIFLSSGGIVS